MDEPKWRPSPVKTYKGRAPSVTARMMSAVRGKENKSEVALRRELWRMGFRYRLQYRGLIGRPDLVLPKYKTAIFVDGDFWHGRALRDGGEEQLRVVVRGPRYDWWLAKLSKNVARDDRVTKTLRDAGWRVIRVWESDVLKDLHSSALAIAAELRGGR